MDKHEALLQNYRTRVEHLEIQHQELRSKSKRFSLVRFLVFVLAAVCLYQAITAASSVWWVSGTLALVVLFLILIHRHSELKYRLAVVDKLKEINQNEINVLQQLPSIFSDGTEYHQSYTYTSDLDIFGPRSLFHMIQRCFSEPGRKALSDWLTTPKYDTDHLREKQRAVHSIADEIDLRQEFLAHGMVHFSGTEPKFNPDSPLMNQTTARRIHILRWVIPTISLLTIAVAIVTSDNNMLLYGFILNLMITGAFYKTTSKVLLRAEENLKNLGNYRESLKIVIQHSFDAPLLQAKQKTLSDAYMRIKVLQRRYDLLESRANPIMGMLLNGTVGFDFFVVTRLQQWFSRHATQIPEWEKEIGWIQALFSLGNFARNNPTYTFPEFTRSHGIAGKNIRHPFIPDTENVGNDLSFLDPMRVIILTGSNMSGKSTFLRSLGINQVLALAGSVVAADTFHTGLFGILTSFRKSDSIQEHTSLFYDELKKLRYIFSTLDTSSRTHLVLLDEILRGTNSDDKYYGSKQVLLRLKDENAMSILATHDIDLSQLEQDHHPAIVNYSFESQIREGELHFDYRLQQGIAVNKNATFLMEKMGII